MQVSEQEDVGSEILSTVHIGGDPSTVDVPRESRDKVRAILGIVGGLASATDPEHVLPQILDRLFASFPQAAAGAIFLRDESLSDFRPAAVRRRDSSEGPIPVNRLLLREVAAKKSALLTNESSPEGPRQDLDTATGPLDRSLMITPLIHIDSVLGLIQLEAAPGAVGFSQRDLEVLAGVAGHLAHVIHNSRLHDAALRTQRTSWSSVFAG